MVLFVQHSETRSVWLGKAISWTWRRCPPGAPIPARLLGQMWMMWSLLLLMLTLICMKQQHLVAMLVAERAFSLEHTLSAYHAYFIMLTFQF